MNITITDSEADQRFDRFLRKYFKPHRDVKLSDIYAWIRHGDIKLNGKKSPENKRIQAWDIISRSENTVSLTSPQSATSSKSQKITSFSLKKIRWLIIFEDTHRIRRNKPADMVTHPGNKHTNDITLHDLMQSYLQQTNQKVDSPTFNPSFCFRLDKDTSWIIISAKTYEALQYLNEAIRERNVNKSYLAIVAWDAPQKWEIDSPLFVWFDKKSGKSKSFINYEKGKDSRTTFHKLRTISAQWIGHISLLEVNIETGRMHQIRVHLASQWLPIIGDLMYGNPAINRLAKKHFGVTRQLLHSYSYWFLDPFQNNYLKHTAPTPSIFEQVIPT